MQQAQFIWSNKEGEGRNAYVAFRRKFSCPAPISKAIFNIFADSAYNLFVNGKFVNFGPARFNPAFPEYDTYDISDLLSEGINSIAVLVNHFGVKTYKSVENKAGLIAWGEIVLQNNEKISLNTGSSEWKAFPIKAYDENAPKLSFALNQMEIYDQRKEPSGWKEKDYDDSNWQSAVLLENQKCWGQFSPRSIPFMSNTLIQPEKLLGIYPLLKIEKTFSFRVPVPEFYCKNALKNNQQYIFFKTWLHSPKKQDITIGLFWGEYWVNGKELREKLPSDNNSLRYNHRVSLNAGWNFFCAYVKAYLDEFAFYLNLPTDSGVEPYAEKDLSCPHSFSYTQPISQTEFESIVKKLGIPFQEDSNLGLKWNFWERNNTAINPGRENDLDFYGEKFQYIDIQQLNNHVFKKSDYPDGFAIIIDMGKTCLFRIGLDIEGVKDTTVDISFSERLRHKKLLLYLHHNYHASLRTVFSENSVSWESFHAYGGRYLALTFRNLKNDIRIKNLRFISANYPAQLKGSFNCSENIFNKIWQICADTQRADMEDAYIDCPTRERGMYARDGIIQYFNNLALFGDHALMKRFLALFAQNPASCGRMKAVAPTSEDYVIADFSLNLVEGFYVYFLNTGDCGFIRENWATILKNMQWFDKLSDMDETGLLTLDWPGRTNKGYQGGFHGDLSATDERMCKKGLSCVFTCTYLCAIKAIKALAQILNDKEKVAEYSERLKKVSKNARRYFWDKEKNCFSDDINHTTHSVQANFMAVLADMPAKAQLPMVRNHLDETLKNFFINGYDASDGDLVSPSYAFYMFEALYKLGLVERTEEVMSKGWGLMLADGLKTCREYFSRHHDSFCHAWSAHPVYFLSRHVLGVSFPYAPDFSKVLIDVNTSSVSWAEGTYPHPDGIIYVKWHLDKNGKRSFEVKAPKGVQILFSSVKDKIK